MPFDKNKQTNKQTKKQHINTGRAVAYVMFKKRFSWDAGSNSDFSNAI